MAKDIIKMLLEAVKAESVNGYRLKSIELTNNSNRLSRTVDITYSYEPAEEENKEEPV